MIHRLTLADVKNRLHGISPEIEVMSTQYKNNSMPLHLQCRKCECKWNASAHNLLKKKNPTGCPRCGLEKQASSHRLTFEEVEAKLNKTLKLLSFENGVVSKKEKTNLMCEVMCKKCEHRWKATLCNLVHNHKKGHRLHGCPKCLKRRKAEDPFNPRLTITEVKRLYAKRQRGLKFIGPYLNYNTRFEVECRRCSHRWMTTMAMSIYPQYPRPKQTCPKCYPTKYGASEERAREVVEKVVGKFFPKAKPSDVPWLKGMHLDGYNKKLRIAFEHQGYQHYTWDCHFHGKNVIERKKAFEELKRRDARKRFQCMYHEVLLIVIPYWMDEKEIEKLVRKKLEGRGILKKKKKRRKPVSL